MKINIQVERGVTVECTLASQTSGAKWVVTFGAVTGYGEAPEEAVVNFRYRLTDFWEGF